MIQALKTYSGYQDSGLPWPAGIPDCYEQMQALGGDNHNE